MTLSLPTRSAAVLVLLLLPAPLVIVIGSSFSPDTVMRFPPQGLSLRWYAVLFGDGRWLTSFAASAAIAAFSAVATTAAAVGAALALQGSSERVRGIAETAIVSPLLFPHAAIGIAFLSWLATLHLNGRIGGVVIAHLVLCAPFAYRPIAVSLRQIDRSLPEAAMILGAEQKQVLGKVILPLMRPGIATSLLFSFIISFDEITVTMFLVGPTFTTLPVSIYSYLHDSVDPVVAAVSSLLIGITVLLVVVMDRVAGLKMFIDVEADSKRGTA